MQKVMLMRLICIMYNNFQIESQLEPQPCIFSYCIRLKHVLCFCFFRLPFMTNLILFICIKTSSVENVCGPQYATGYCGDE